jgi:23S rRNA (adenine(2503)-C(2))-methyltransferase
MVKPRKLSPYSIYDEHALLAFLDEHDVKHIHAKSIWKHIIKHKVESIDEIDKVPALPTGLAEKIKNVFVISTSRVKSVHRSIDGTCKLLVELQDGLTVETVIIPSGATTGDTPKGNPRTTLCVSSQVGCKMGCTFCATGTMGEIGNLCAGEICEQLVHANKEATVRNIVFMGMGEPLNNYEPVAAAIRAMTDTHRFGLSPNHVTLSTVGIIPRMIQVAKEMPNINLALSLHAPNQEVREKFVPAARAFPFDKLIGACDDYMQITGRKILIEYCVLAGDNDQPEHAKELAELMEGKDVTINLIPYNPTYNPRLDNPHAAPEMETILNMKQTLYEHGVRTTIRKEKGQDIAGACGQLVVQDKATAGGSGAAGADIEDLMSGKSSGGCCDSNDTAQPRQRKGKGGGDVVLGGCNSNGMSTSSGSSNPASTAASTAATIQAPSNSKGLTKRAIGLICLAGAVVLLILFLQELMQRQQ